MILWAAMRQMRGTGRAHTPAAGEALGDCAGTVRNYCRCVLTHARLARPPVAPAPLANVYGPAASACPAKSENNVIAQRLEHHANKLFFVFLSHAERLLRHHTPNQATFDLPSHDLMSIHS
jgi:hypothetical protein